MRPVTNLAGRVFVAVSGGAAAAAVLLTGSPASGSISQATVSSPGGYVQAGVYPMTASTFSPGGDLEATFGQGAGFQEMAFMGNASAGAAAAYSDASVTLSAEGVVSLGRVRMRAFNRHPNTGLFALGAANGGWKETFTVSHPDLSGQSGFLVFSLGAKGTIDAAGFSGAGGVVVSLFKDEFHLSVNEHFDRGDSDGLSTDRQTVAWTLSSFGPAESRTIDGQATFAVPITFGVPCRVGVCAYLLAGQSSQIGIVADSTGETDFFGEGVFWNGIVGVHSASGPVTGYTVISGSGLDWSGPISQCPADLSGSTDPNDPAYGVPDGIVDATDFFYFLDQFVASNLAVADISGSSDPNDPAYGVPDGSIDAADFFYFLDLFVAGCP